VLQAGVVGIAIALLPGILGILKVSRSGGAAGSQLCSFHLCELHHQFSASFSALWTVEQLGHLDHAGFDTAEHHVMAA
jgi:hypothetical protein